MAREDALTGQRAYYRQAAAAYSDTHVRPGDEHFVALEFIRGLLSVARVRSVLDVGAGTGRAVRFLGDDPSLHVVGVEPVDELRAQALELGGEFVPGSGEALPFGDDEFDAVIATGVMHHVPDPARVITEMTRVARRAVMISDTNRFGRGSRLAGAVKVGLWQAHLWKAYNHLHTHGQGYLTLAGDGNHYSYSVFDSLPLVATWSDRAFVIPTGARANSRAGALLSSSHGLLIGLREPPDFAGRLRAG